MSKRNARQNEHNPGKMGETLFLMPEELWKLLTEHVWIMCFEMKDILNWHSTCKFYWNEYQGFEDANLFEKIEYKKQQNTILLKKTLHARFRDNIIDFEDLRRIIAATIALKELILKISSSGVEYAKYRKDSLAAVHGWEQWEGIDFDNGILCEHSQLLLKGISNRLLLRYGWKMSFDSPEERLEYEIGYPFDKPIAEGYECSIISAPSWLLYFVLSLKS